MAEERYALRCDTTILLISSILPALLKLLTRLL
jgi:hypothetical protein